MKLKAIFASIALLLFLQACETPSSTRTTIIIDPEIEFKPGEYPKIYSYLKALKAKSIKLESPKEDEYLGFDQTLELTVEDSKAFESSSEEDVSWLSQKVAKIIYEGVKNPYVYSGIDMEFTGNSTGSFYYTESDL
ncbi:MAG: hypothetical protein MRZ79_06620 [Bacteroidia bacterium]|nr:hypothetical protein [Bacteroidia bacterium]